MQEYFWSISIEEGIIQAAIWSIREAQATIFKFSDPQLYEDDESLVTACDTCLSTCIQDLPAGVSEPTKTTFGVPSYWVKDGQIEKDILDKIKLLCDKLSLKPVGFVVMPEAISHFQKIEEKTPVSAILIGVYEQNLDVSLFRLGNLAGSVKVGRSANIADDVNEGLARFGTTEAFPSRFLLYGLKQQDLEDIKQSLIKADLDTNPDVKFLHTPQIEVFDSKSKMAAISLAGAAELNQADNISFEGDGEKLEQVEESNLEEAEVSEGVVDPSALGFSTNEDVAALAISSLPAKPFKALPEFGFMSKLKFKLPVKGNNLFFVGVVAVLAILIAFFSSWVFLSKAQVTLALNPKTIDEKKQVKFDTTINSIDLSALKVPVKQISATASGDKTKTVTGTVTIGHPSKGSVTFYNVSGSTTIPKGTTLSSSNLEFSLDNDVTIASASGAASAATAQGSITADAVGADSNLAGGSYFTVSGFSPSLIQAKNDSDLAGGSSQEVTAVSSDDVSSLTSDLTKELTDQGKNNLKSNLNSPYLLIDSSVNSVTTSHSLDNDVNEQASTVKLNMAMKVSGLEVSRDDMDNLARQLFADKVPEGYTLTDDQIDFVFGKDGVEFIINLLPQIDKNQMVKQITGKNLNVARGILSRISGFDDVVFLLKPNIPFLQILPMRANNINISINAKTETN